MSNEYMLIPYHLRETLSDILRQPDVYNIDLAEIIEAAPLHISPAPDGEVDGLWEAAERVVKAFECYGQSRTIIANEKGRRECEASMVALKAALEQTR